jgi:hypothetical protein
MTWHVLTVAKGALSGALNAIRSNGGTATATKHAGASACITYVTSLSH